MDIKDYSQMMRYLTRPRDVVPDPSTMDQEPRNMYGQGLSVDHAVRTVNPEQDSFKKLSNVLGAYRRYRRGEKNPKINFNQFFELYSTENFAEGGRTGFKRGKSATTLTPQMVIDIADNNPDFTATDILNKLQKDKTKNYVTSKGTPINRSVINRTLSDTFDLAAAEKAKVPAGYISSAEFFKTEGIPISKRDYMTVKNRNPSLLTDTIGKNAIFIKRGTSGEGTFYFKKPTNKDLKLYQKIASRKGQLAKNTIKLMLEFDKKFSKFYENGKLPTIDKIQEVFPDITPSTAGNVTARLSQWYNGSDFINPELEGINRNKSLATKIQKASANSQYGNFYADQAYKVALDTIDERIGRQVGSFKAFKDNIKTALKEAGLPIYSKNSPYGFNLNEMAGITGASRTKTAAFSDFVDIAEGDFNQKKLARFQKDFATIREKLDKLDLPNNPQNRKQALLLIKGFEDTIKYYENATGSELPKLGLGTADQYYSAEKLSDIGKERSVGETGKKKNRRIPGTDLFGSSQKSGYTVIVPENYRTVGQIMETGERGTLKKNVQNTLDGMKKFFNEYDEKKMFQKLKNSSPDVLKKMMKVIPKVVSLEDDFTNAYGFPLTAGLDSSIGVKKEDKTFAERNPLTTQTGLTGAGTAGVLKATGTPIKEALGKTFKTLGTRTGVTPFAGYTIYDNLKKGENVADAIVDPMVGIELMLPNMFKENVAKITKNKAFQKALSLGYKIPKTAFTIGRSFTPIGAGITAAGLGIDAYKYGKERKQLLDSLTDEQKTNLFRQEQSNVVKQQLRGDQNAFDEFSAARGGIASLNVKK